MSTSCDVELMVKRGTAVKAAPQQRLTVKCPIKHCGEPQNVTWCKMLEATRCEEIDCTENVEITQNDKPENKLISFLTFIRISIHDGGLYRCGLKGKKFELSHIINISVSELNQGVKSSDNNADELPSVVGNSPIAGDEDVSWLPYFSICVSTALLILTLTVMTLLSFHGWKRTLTFSDTNRQKMSSHVIPSLPKVNPPSTPILQSHLTIENDIYSRSTAEKPSQPPPMTDGSQPASANTSNAVYAVIKYCQSGIPAREQHAAARQDKKAEYAVINVP
ncbi:hypothetical protein L3Q82_017552 [Scortum barcoo]|uniref:Uncharacterized protein n=1 Tax=Scortum barcoo TaxID=214431 RepID=A0ACB8VKX0_9TELE|nr:hypothetical protein L3Q82_017552 [Scortum barcoo]